MSLKWRAIASALLRHPFSLRSVRSVASATALCGALIVVSSCGSDLSKPNTPVTIATITITGGDRNLERGSVDSLIAVAKDASGKVVSVPFAWRSTPDSVATIDLNGKLTTGVPGVASVTASALGVSSQGIQIHVVWQGAADIAISQFTPPNAITPGSSPTDSIRVVVKNPQGAFAPGALVAFKVTAGGGTVAPSVAKVGSTGIAAAKWILGPNVGVNTATATVVGPDSQTVPTWVTHNPVTFTVKSYNALTVLQGDNQSGSVLSTLPLAPSIKLVDSAGKPRAGIPITFAATSNGRVANTVASTSVDGIASPGIWTLGDSAGVEKLFVTVESAKLTLSATATGSTVRFAAAQVAMAQLATCAMTSDQFVSCMGQAPQVGTGDTVTKTSPALTAGGIHLTSFSGGGAHFCGTATDASIYCWGIFALVDTLNGMTTNGGSPATLQPTRLQSNIGWLQVTSGGQHNCGLANDQVAYCWGSDTSGQLGDNNLTRHLVPQPVTGGFKFSQLAAGTSHECGIITKVSVSLDSTAVCWGLNSTGQLGDGTTTLRKTPTAVSGGLHWKTLGAGVGWTCGLTADGTPYCWGAGTPSASPAIVGATTQKLSSLSVGAAHACGLDNGGIAYCWGDNSSGQLGDSTTVTRTTPTPVASTFRFKTITAGNQQTCAVTTDNLLACWGRNTVGEIGLSTPLIQLTPRYVVVGVLP